LNRPVSAIAAPYAVHQRHRRSAAARTQQVGRDDGEHDDRPVGARILRIVGRLSAAANNSPATSPVSAGAGSAASRASLLPSAAVNPAVITIPSSEGSRSATADVPSRLTTKCMHR